MACVSLLCCVPVEELTVPRNVDWLAFVGVTSEDYEEGRLYPSDSFDTLAQPQEVGWLVGYRASQFRGLNVAVSGPGAAYVRLARSGDLLLPSPVWRHHFRKVVPLGDLTIQWPGLDISEPLPEPEFYLSLETESYDRLGLEAAGQSDDGDLLFVFGDRSVHRVTGDGLVQIGLHSCFLGVRSIAIHRGRFWLSTKLRDICVGSALDVLDRSPRRLLGRFHIDGFGDLFFVQPNGTILSPTKGFEVLSAGTDSDEFAEFQTSNDVDGSLLAAGQGWSVRKDGDVVLRDLGFRRPFAGVGHGVVYRSQERFLELSTWDAQDHAYIVSRGPGLRAFRTILALVPFAGGFVLIEVGSTDLVWVGPTGQAFEFYTLDYQPTKLFVVDDTLIVVGVEDPSELGAPTLVSRFAVL